MRPEDMFHIENTDGFATGGMCIGLLAIAGCSAASLVDYLAAEEAILVNMRQRFEGLDRKALKALPPMDAYTAYYKRFGQNYPLIQQLESTLRSDKQREADSPLIRAMFIAEMNSMLLTAGHDIEKLRQPITLGLAKGEEAYLSISGRETAAVKGDAYICDREGVLSSILRGPDERTRITAETVDALFTVYAPSGVDTGAVNGMLDELERLIRLFAPASIRQYKGILPA